MNAIFPTPHNILWAILMAPVKFQWISVKRSRNSVIFVKVVNNEWHY